MQTLNRPLPFLAKRPAKADHVTITIPDSPPKLPDHHAGLNKYNSVTISHSSVPQVMPAGRYHYTTFDGIDLYAGNGKPKPIDYEETIAKLEKEIKQLKRSEELVSEQRYFATELVSQLDAHLETLSSKSTTKKELQEGIAYMQRLRSDSMFET
jgi:hypothetical protein